MAANGAGWSAEIEETVERLAGGVGRAVVGVAGGRPATGLVIEPDRVVTAARGLRDGAVEVALPDGRRVEARVVGVDPEGDLAALAVEGAEAPALEWAGGERVRAGTPLFALANPGGRGLRVTLGLATSAPTEPRWGRLGPTVEHTAPLLRGSAASPVVDAAGRLVGLNALRLPGGLALARLADPGLRDRIEALARGEAPTRRRLGVVITPPRAARRLRAAVGLPERSGLLIRRVLDNGPADRAGLAPGDLVVAAGGRPVERPAELVAALRDARDDGLELTVVRGVEERQVAVALGSGS
jgi:serine protease Do